MVLASEVTDGGESVMFQIIGDQTVIRAALRQAKDAGLLEPGAFCRVRLVLQ